MFDVSYHQGQPLQRVHTEAGSVTSIQPWLAHCLLDVLDALTGHVSTTVAAAADEAASALKPVGFTGGEPTRLRRPRRRKHTQTNPLGIVELFDHSPA